MLIGGEFMCKHKPTLKSFLFPKVETLQTGKHNYVYVCKLCGEKLYLRPSKFMICFLIEYTIFHFGLTCLIHNWFNISNNYLKFIIPLLAMIFLLVIAKVIEYNVISCTRQGDD